MDGYGWMVRGRELHLRGRPHNAEVAYREAIKRGRDDAWPLLAVLLWAQPGRLQDELTAHRAAMDGTNRKEAASAAGTLGHTLVFVCDDAPAARRCFVFADENGSPEVRRRALTALFHLDVREGKTADATARFTQVISAQVAGVDDKTINRIAGIAVSLERAFYWYWLNRVLYRLLRYSWGAASQSRRIKIVNWRTRKLGDQPLGRLVTEP